MKKKNVLIACEFSGIVRDAFLKRGHNAISCDLLPTESPGPHVQGDVAGLLRHEWDLVIAHPPCTYLCNSGVRWLKGNCERIHEMYKACGFFNLFLRGIIREHTTSICVENPIQHGCARQKIIKYDQIVQPWQFGHGETKATCLWLHNLPKLKPTKIMEERVGRIHLMTPSKDRSKLRSITYMGIAEAMANQWG